MKRIAFFLVACAIAALGHAGSANADIIYTLTYDSCTGGCGNGQGTNNNTFGYVTLHQVNSSTVSISETLTSGDTMALSDYYVNTGSGGHQPFAFNLDKAVVITGVTPSTYFAAGTGSTTISGLGTFSNYISCTSNCGSGASGSTLYGQSITFSTANGSSLSYADFISNSSGFLFASDIIGGYPSGNTGEVAAYASSACNTATTTCAGANVTTPTATPEPSTIVIFGTSLLGLSLSGRRLRRA